MMISIHIHTHTHTHTHAFISETMFLLDIVFFVFLSVFYACKYQVRIHRWADTAMLCKDMSACKWMLKSVMSQW